MAVRLAVIAHAPTHGQRDLVFGDRSELVHPELVARSADRVNRWLCGPEPACTATSGLLGGAAAVDDRLAGPQLGSWIGHTLAEVAAADPVGLQAWLSDASATPHGGESLAGLVLRVGEVVDEDSWPAGRSAAVVTPLVARAVAVHALGVAADVLFRIDVAPLGRLSLSRSGSGWRLVFR